VQQVKRTICKSARVLFDINVVETVDENVVNPVVQYIGCQLYTNKNITNLFHKHSNCIRDS
jgi:hypothetical protein